MVIGFAICRNLNPNSRIPDTCFSKQSTETEGGPSLAVVIDDFHARLTGVVILFASVPEEPEDVTDFAFSGEH